MSDLDNDNVELDVPDELTTLKARADRLGISYHPSIGLEKLKEKVNATVTATEVKAEAPEVTVTAEESKEQRRKRKRLEANTLVRVRITCMNPAKKEWEGELFTAGNSVVGSFTKYVPFNTDEGWHVPQIILNQIQQRMCQIFVSSKDDRGNTVRKGKQIKEFSVEIMPSLSEEELRNLAQRQAMANGTSSTN
jgi:hypothetical protein